MRSPENHNPTHNHHTLHQSGLDNQETMESLPGSSSRQVQTSSSSVGDVSQLSATVSVNDTAATLGNSEPETGRIRFPPSVIPPKYRQAHPTTTATSSPSRSRSQCKYSGNSKESRTTENTKGFSAGSIGLSQLGPSITPCFEPEHEQPAHPSPQPGALQPVTHKPADSDTQAQLEWLGYRQELPRNWDFWSVFSLGFCNIGVTLAAFWGLYSSLIAGGPIVMTWGFMLGAILTSVMTAVMAEVASAYPVTGAMFTWTFKLARSHPRFRKWASFLSWIVGWMMLIAIVLSQMQLSLQFTHIFSSGIRASGVSWDYQIWQSYLIISANILFCGLVVSIPQTRSPLMWKVLGAIVITLHMSICIVLLTTANQRRKFLTIFTTFENRTAYKSKGWTFLYGWSLSALVVGTEPSAHIAEETRHAASTVPRAMFYSVTFSFVIGLFATIASTLTLIPLHHRITKTWPIMDLLFSHLPRPAAQFVFISLLIIMLVQSVSQMLAATRFTWALARDGVLPFSSYWRRVNPNTRIPRRATGLLIGLGMLSATTYIDETGTLINISIQLSALLTVCSYLVPVFLYLSSPRGVLDYDGRNVWTLRKFGRPLAGITLLYLILQIILYSSPSVPHPDRNNWGYGPFLLVGVTLLASVSWIMYGRARYIGPIKSITVWSAGQEVEFPKTTSYPSHENNSSSITAPRVLPQPHDYLSYTSPGDRITQNIPNAFQTYGTDGSMWCGTNLVAQSSAVTLD